MELMNLDTVTEWYDRPGRTVLITGGAGVLYANEDARPFSYLHIARYVRVIAGQEQGNW
jgi:hypothetical protein